MEVARRGEWPHLACPFRTPNAHLRRQEQLLAASAVHCRPGRAVLELAAAHATDSAVRVTLCQALVRGDFLPGGPTLGLRVKMLSKAWHENAKQVLVHSAYIVVVA